MFGTAFFAGETKKPVRVVAIDDFSSVYIDSPKRQAQEQGATYTTSARPEDKAMLGTNLSAESETESEELTVT